MIIIGSKLKIDRNNKLITINISMTLKMSLNFLLPLYNYFATDYGHIYRKIIQQNHCNHCIKILIQYIESDNKIDLIVKYPYYYDIFYEIKKLDLNQNKYELIKQLNEFNDITYTILNEFIRKDLFSNNNTNKNKSTIISDNINNNTIVSDNINKNNVNDNINNITKLTNKHNVHTKSNNIIDNNESQKRNRDEEIIDMPVAKKIKSEHTIGFYDKSRDPRLKNKQNTDTLDYSNLLNSIVKINNSDEQKHADSHLTYKSTYTEDKKQLAKDVKYYLNTIHRKTKYSNREVHNILCSHGNRCSCYYGTYVHDIPCNCSICKYKFMHSENINTLIYIYDYIEEIVESHKHSNMPMSPHCHGLLSHSCNSYNCPSYKYK